MGAPQRSISVMDVALAAHFKQGRTISGRGIYMKPKSTPDPETGEMDPDSGHAHACTVAEVEVDTETGVVRVTRLVSSYEVGRAINPAMVQQQIFGGAFMGMAHALYETTAPYYPDPENAPKDWSEYILPGWGELVDMDSIILQRPLESGPCGAKGVGEMTANSPIAAIVNAVADAIGVRITSVPITPEKVLRALDEVAER
jgi:CO/xanthine dehydrogenase Mo-binding subunit